MPSEKIGLGVDLGRGRGAERRGQEDRGAGGQLADGHALSLLGEADWGMISIRRSDGRRAMITRPRVPSPRPGTGSSGGPITRRGDAERRASSRRLHVVRQGGGELQRRAGAGVGQAEAVGVQGLAVDEDAIGVGGVGAEEVAEGQAVAAGVELVGDDRAADVRQVDADLVGPAGLRACSGRGRSRGSARRPRRRCEAALPPSSGRRMAIFSRWVGWGPMGFST